MADNDRENGEKSYFNSSNRNQSGLEDNDEESEDSNPQPDIGLGSSCLRTSGRKNVVDGSCAAGSGSEALPRREENPFSFKHFLNQNSSSSHQSGGARPKVFSTPAPVQAPASPSNSCPAPRLVSNPELASGLPDFVQDHLVVEQCYLSNSNQGPAHLAVDLDNLPDFAPVQTNNDQWNSTGVLDDIPFDLTSNQDVRQQQRQRERNRRVRDNEAPPAVLPLDLPESLPFDLPASGREVSGEVGASKSLPDFLSDGPIHSERRNENSQPPSEVNSPSASTPDQRHSPRLQMENERLRRELESVRRQLIEQVMRNEVLELELASLRSREYEDTAGLEKIIEQIEDNLKRTTKRAVTAEGRVSKLKQEIKSLTTEINELKGQGATASSLDKPNPHRLACELRAAASSAEISLRQLLTGVDNLRVIASTLENRNRIEEDPTDFLDSDTLGEPGPAL